jgi:hypothetical protein
MRKKMFKGLGKMSKQIFLLKIFTTNTVCTNVHKLYECDKNQMPYYNVKTLKKWNFWEFWAIDKTWPTLDTFCYS